MEYDSFPKFPLQVDIKICSTIKLEILTLIHSFGFCALWTNIQNISNNLKLSEVTCDKVKKERNFPWLYIPIP